MKIEKQFVFVAVCSHTRLGSDHASAERKKGAFSPMAIVCPLMFAAATPVAPRNLMREQFLPPTEKIY